MTDLIAMGLSGGRAVESRSEDAFVAHEHAANEGAVTGASFGDRIRDLQKIRIPFGAQEELSFPK